jgi:hypothetical protein
MGSNLLILFATSFLVQLPQSTTQSNPTQRDSSESEDAQGAGIAYERLSDALGYNRVQGLSIGAGYRLPAASQTHLYTTIRYGLSDDRVTGRMSLVHHAGRTRYSLSGYDDIDDVDPFAPGQSLNNSLNALFVAHDNGDYLLAQGGAVSVETELNPTLELAVTARVERERSVARAAASELNDFLGGSGQFPPNPSITEGTFERFSASLSGLRRTRWNVVLEVLTGPVPAIPRMHADVRRNLGWRGVALHLKGGIGTQPSQPQMLFRLGGLSTVRGFEYGTFRGPSFWAAQLDVAPLRGRIRPVVFIDAGQAGEPSSLFSNQALVGAGAGLSLLSGLVRLEFSRPVSPDIGGKIRFDLVVEAGR